MLEVVAVAQIQPLVLAAQVVGAQVVRAIQQAKPYLELQTLVAEEVVTVDLLRLFHLAQAAQVLSSSRPINNEGLMETKIYRLYGIDTAMHLLRPGAKWEITNSHFSNWEDPRPCPKWEEVLDTMEKIKAFEDSINTVWLPEQIEALTGQAEIQAQVDRIIEEQKVA